MFSDLSEFFRHADSSPFVMVLLFLFILAGLGLWLAYRHLHRLRIVEDTPTSLIRSAAQGFVEFQGHARLMPGQPVLAPLTGTPCIWYRFKVMERYSANSSGIKGNRWRTLREGSSDELFLIVDGTGECVVDPEGAEITPSSKRVWYSDSSTPQFDSNLPSTGLLASGRYRYQEELIDEFDPLYILGLYKTVGDSADLGSVKDDVREILRAWKSDPQRMREIDTNTDGRIDPEEWDSARRAAESEALNQRAERAAAGGTNLIMKPRDRRRPYLLSVKAPEDILSRFRWVSRAGWILFFSCGVLALWGLGIRISA